MRSTTSLDELLKFAYEKGYFSGAWLYKKDGAVISKGALGYTRPDQKEALNTDTLFEIASITKQFTAAAIMLLRDRGMLSLDDPLEKYFPQIRYPHIRVRNLLNHTSGLPDYTDLLGAYVKKHGGIPGNQVIEEMLNTPGIPRQFEPGQQWAYCNTAFCALALVIEKVTGKSYPDFMRMELFLPCGMERTWVFHLFKDGNEPPNYAYGMALQDGRYLLVEDSIRESYVVPLDGGEGDGSVKTSVEDMLRWDEALRLEALLPRSTQNEMYTETRLLSGDTYPYGYGWNIKQNEKSGRWISHHGRWAGYNGIFARMLDRDSMVVVLCNQIGCDTMARIEMLDGIGNILSEGSAQLPCSLDEKADQTVDVGSLGYLSGSYRGQTPGISGLFGDTIRIYVESESLRMHLSFMDTVYDTQLVPINATCFIARDGLFDITFDGDTLSTSMYNKKFLFTREK